MLTADQEAYLNDSGGDYDMERFDTWFQHRLWRRCPVEDCEWCKREADRPRIDPKHGDVARRRRTQW